MVQKDKKVLLIRQVRHWKWDMVNRYNLSIKSKMITKL